MGRRPALVSLRARGKQVIFLTEERSAGLLSPPDVFYFITEETQDWNQQSSACSRDFSTSYILLISGAPLSTETSDEL